MTVRGRSTTGRCEVVARQADKQLTNKRRTKDEQKTNKRRTKDEQKTNKRQRITRVKIYLNCI